jgi:SpoVK/Ycf46/Vps4 family AAA+-type ATPase
MARGTQLETLIRAHYQKQEHWFRQLSLEIAKTQKSPDAQERIRKVIADSEIIPSKARGMMHEVAPVSLDDLVLSDELRNELELVAAEHASFGALAAHNLTPRSRLLFHGPAGNGKTSAAAALGALLGKPVYSLSLPKLVDSHLGSTGTNLDIAFSALSSGMVLLLDEIDAVGSARNNTSSGADKENNRIVNTLLTLLDQQVNGVLVATTNRADMLDSALLRRFDLELEFPAPTARQLGLYAQTLCCRHRVPSTCAALADCTSFAIAQRQVTAAARRWVLGQSAERAAS